MRLNKYHVRGLNKYHFSRLDKYHLSRLSKVDFFPNKLLKKSYFNRILMLFRNLFLKSPNKFRGINKVALVKTYKADQKAYC